MSNYPTNRLYTAIASGGDKTIPPETAAAAGTGRLSQQKGFDTVNSQPLTQGGIPPFRQDFNGIFNLFSQFLLWYQPPPHANLLLLPEACIVSVTQ